MPIFRSGNGTVALGSGQSPPVNTRDTYTPSVLTSFRNICVCATQSAGCVICAWHTAVKTVHLLHKPISTYKYMNAVYFPMTTWWWLQLHHTRLPSINSIFTAIIFNRKQGGEYVIQENQILSVLSHVSNLAGFFCVSIYLEYNTAEGKTKILTCLRLAQALLLPPGVNKFVQIHHPLHHPKAY